MALSLGSVTDMDAQMKAAHFTDAQIEQLGETGRAIMVTGIDQKKFAEEDFPAALLNYGLRVLVEPKTIPNKPFQRDDEKSIIFGAEVIATTLLTDSLIRAPTGMVVNPHLPQLARGSNMKEGRVYMTVLPFQGAKITVPLASSDYFYHSVNSAELKNTAYYSAFTAVLQTKVIEVKIKRRCMQ